MRMNIKNNWAAIQKALEHRIKEKGGFQLNASKIGVSDDTLYNWIRKDAPPKFFEMVTLLENLGYGGISNLIESRVQGVIEQDGEEAVRVPIYDVELSAGNGLINQEGEASGYHTFPINMISSLTKHSQYDQLAILQVKGDSMKPTMEDGDYVMIDLTDTQIKDGLYAFVMQDEARVKRLQTLFDGVTIKSDYDTKYDSEFLKTEAVNQLKIIGRVIWRSGAV